jgi:hypothetical protein
MMMTVWLSKLAKNRQETQIVDADEDFLLLKTQLLTGRLIF